MYADNPALPTGRAADPKKKTTMTEPNRTRGSEMYLMNEAMARARMRWAHVEKVGRRRPAREVAMEARRRTTER